MADPSFRRSLAARLALIGVLAAGCAAGPQPGEDDPSAPVLFTAEVLEIGPKAVPGARYQVLVYEGDDALLGQSEPPLIDALYTAGTDGTFDVHYEPTPELRGWSRYNGLPITFSVFVLDPNSDLVFPFHFVRDLGSDAWAGDPVTISIYPDQSEYWYSMDRLVPPSRPGAT